MAPPDSDYVRSPRPVNRRTAPRPGVKAAKPAVLPAAVHGRLAAQRAQTRLGRPLAEQLRASRQTGSPTRLGPWHIVGGVMATAAGVALLLAWIESSWPLAAAAGGALVAAGGLALYGRRAAAQASPAPEPTATLFDEASLLAFDRLLAQRGASLPEAVQDRLVALKQHLARIAQQAASATAGEHFTLDDRLYLAELVRRYLPDSLQAYFLVPQAQRATLRLEQDQTAQALLLGQIELFCAELERQETKLARDQGEALLRQQRFLQAKRHGSWSDDNGAGR
ncbi:MAG: hypothetical protein ACWA6Y_07450 [Polaromonas sp.]